MLIIGRCHRSLIAKMGDVASVEAEKSSCSCGGLKVWRYEGGGGERGVKAGRYEEETGVEPAVAASALRHVTHVLLFGEGEGGENKVESNALMACGLGVRGTCVYGRRCRRSWDIMHERRSGKPK